LTISDDGAYCVYGGQNEIIGITSLDERNNYIEILDIKGIKIN